MTILNIHDFNLTNKRVLIREDLNVPITDGKVSSDVRLRAVVPTIEFALKQGAVVILMSHLGRPKPGENNVSYSLRPVAQHLSHLLRQEVKFAENYLQGVSVAPGEVVLLENIRFNAGEEINDPELSQQLAKLCDIYVMDAFATAHRAHASTCGIINYAPIACAGPLLMAELDALHRALNQPQAPVLAIVGGAKVSTKLAVLENLLNKVELLIVGGGITNTFLAAEGYEIGQSLYEEALLPTAKTLLKDAKLQGVEIPLPEDVIVGEAFSPTTTATIKTIDNIAKQDMILDIGPKTAERFATIAKQAKTILWNGPVGVFEFEQFSQGTSVLAHAIAEADAFSIAGGGDTLAAIEKFQLAKKISYISTGGGAFLKFVEGKTLPAVAALENRG